MTQIYLNILRSLLSSAVFLLIISPTFTENDSYLVYKNRISELYDIESEDNIELEKNIIETKFCPYDNQIPSLQFIKQLKLKANNSYQTKVRSPNITLTESQNGSSKKLGIPGEAITESLNVKKEFPKQGQPPQQVPPATSLEAPKGLGVSIR